RPRRPPPVPYTTLFRSRRFFRELCLALGFGRGVRHRLRELDEKIAALGLVLQVRDHEVRDLDERLLEGDAFARAGDDLFPPERRSEEHTSELQSRENLV